MHVFCFSSGVSPDDERALKDLAASKGLLLLGPDCGTAILDGVAIGFANAVEPGPVGIIGASGTGTQEVCCLLDAAGVGVSHAIGVGARDLSPEIGGTMTFRALDLLVDDPATQTIVVVSKPIDADAARALAAHAAEGSTPVVVAIPGASAPVVAGSLGRIGGEVQIVGSLETAASVAAAFHGRAIPSEDVTPSHLTPGFVRGVFSGGTLCAEAAGVAVGALGAVTTNVAVPGTMPLSDVWDSIGHTFVDLGDEALTQGRLHPMIDPTLRNARALREGLDPSVGVLLMDVVLGFGAHPDPAEGLVSLIEEIFDARAGSLSVIVSLCGSNADPQDRADQRHRLEAAGAMVTRSAAGAARLAIAAAGGATPPGAQGRAP
jgi:FdrA protein